MDLKHHLWKSKGKCDCIQVKTKGLVSLSVSGWKSLKSRLIMNLAEQTEPSTSV